MIKVIAGSSPAEVIKPVSDSNSVYIIEQNDDSYSSEKSNKLL